jgi:hypothetical protein
MYQSSGKDGSASIDLSIIPSGSPFRELDVGCQLVEFLMTVSIFEVD